MVRFFPKLDEHTINLEVSSDLPISRVLSEVESKVPGFLSSQSYVVTGGKATSKHTLFGELRIDDGAHIFLLKREPGGAPKAARWESTDTVVGWQISEEALKNQLEVGNGSSPLSLPIGCASNVDDSDEGLFNLCFETAVKVASRKKTNKHMAIFVPGHMRMQLNYKGVDVKACFETVLTSNDPLNEKIDVKPVIIVNLSTKADMYITYKHSEEISDLGEERQDFYFTLYK